MLPTVSTPPQAHLRQYHNQPDPLPPTLKPLTQAQLTRRAANYPLSISVENPYTNRTTNQNDPWKVIAPTSNPLQIGSRVRITGTQDAGIITEIHRIRIDDVIFKVATRDHLRPFWISVPKRYTRITILERWTHTVKQQYLNWRFHDHDLEEHPNFLTLKD